MNQQGKARTREEEARTISPGGPSPSSTLPAGTERNGRREEEAGWGATTGGRQEDPQQVRACGGVGRGAEAGEGPLQELGEGEQKLREQPTEA